LGAKTRYVGRGKFARPSPSPSAKTPATVSMTPRTSPQQGKA